MTETNPPKVVCLNQKANGEVCMVPALVHEVRNLYSHNPPTKGEPVIGAEYRLECPDCGMRTRTEFFDLL